MATTLTYASEDGYSAQYHDGFRRPSALNSAQRKSPLPFIVDPSSAPSSILPISSYIGSRYSYGRSWDDVSV